VDDDEYLTEAMSKPVIKMQDYEYHELSTVFSSFEDTEEFKGLVKSVKEYGLFDPILVWQGKIVDGRHRHKACIEAGVEPEYEYLVDEIPFDKVLGRVVGANILRRHLTTGQRAMIAASLANMTDGGGGNQYTKVDWTNLSDAKKKSNEAAAKTLSVSPMTVKNAKEVKRDAPDLAEKVSRGEMSLNAAKVESRERKGETPKQKTNAPKVIDMSLDEMMRIKGDSWDSYTAAGALVSTVRDLNLQEGGEGMVRSIMHFLVSREDKHSHSYNAAGLVALVEGLTGHLEELKEMSVYKSKTTETQN
jgi:hypothetical protein